MAAEDVSRPFIEKLEFQKVDCDELSESTNEDAVKRLTSSQLSLHQYVFLTDTQAGRSFSRLTRYANIFLFTTSISCLLASTFLYNRVSTLSAKSGDPATLLQSSISYASIITSPISFHTTQFTSAPLTSHNASIYRQSPSPAVDAAWDRLSDIGTHILSTPQILSLGKDPLLTVKLPLSFGYGPDAHIGTLDGIHLVHCLNTLRKSLHPNYPYYHPLSTSPGPEYMPHLTHCLEAVLQHLMCRPSMEMLTHNWIPRQDAPFPDFAVNKKCWDYETLLSWKEENRMRGVEERFKELRPPKGTVRVEMPELVRETWDIIDRKEV